MTAHTPNPGRTSLGLGRGTALYLGAVLGPGVLALPGLAAAAAGPAAIAAWIGLLALSVPVATTFANLAARWPDAGGVSTFTRRAFGDRAARVAGWWFYSVIPVGATAAALIGAAYIAEATGLGRPATLAVAAGLLALAFGAGHLGLRPSGSAQLVLMGLLIALLAAAVATALPSLEPANFTPFAPHGIGGILSAAAVLFFAFAGWEAASHLSAEFTDPARHLHRVTALTLAVVAAVYLGLATVTTGVLGPDAATSETPLTDLLAIGFGSLSAPITAAAAAILTLGAMNSFIAGASRLGAALARDGAAPRFLAKGSGTGQTPHRSLGLLAVLSAATFAAALAWNLDLDQLMRATSACLAAVTVLATAAATRLLTGAARATAWCAASFTAVVCAALGAYLLVPAAVAALALAWRPRRDRPGAVTLQRTTPAGAAPPAIRGAP